MNELPVAENSLNRSNKPDSGGFAAKMHIAYSLLELCLLYVDKVGVKNKKIKHFITLFIKVQMIFQMIFKVVELFPKKEEKPFLYPREYLERTRKDLVCAYECSYVEVVNKNILLSYILDNTHIDKVYEIAEGAVVNISEVSLQTLLLKRIFVIEFSDVVGTPMTLLFRNTVVQIFLPRSIEPSQVITAFKERVILAFSKQVLRVTDSEYFIGFAAEKEQRYPYKSEDIYPALQTAVVNALDKNVKIGILLYGVHGVSKSQTIRTVLNSNKECIKALKFIIDSQTCPGEFIKFLSPIKAKKILIFEDMDVLENKIKTSQLSNILAILDSDVYDIFICTTNSNKIDRALTRPGRCDVKIKCNIPNTEECRKICHSLKKQYDVKDVGSYALYNKGLTHADINAIYKKAALKELSIKEVYEEHIATQEAYTQFQIGEEK